MLAAVWISLSLWLVLKPREGNVVPERPWLEVCPALSFDGRRLAFRVDPAAEGHFGRDPLAITDLLVVDRLQGGVTRLSKPGVTYSRPRLSADGGKLIYEASPGPDYLSEIFLSEQPFTGTPTTLRGPYRAGGRGSAFLPNISASGHTVSFVTYRPRGLSGRSWELAVALGTAQNIDTPFPYRVGIATGLVALSPDGQTAAWENRLYNVDGSTSIRLIVAKNGRAQSLEEPAWEPTLSESRCAFVKADDKGVYQIALHDFLTEKTRMITTGNDDSFEPCLSADGEKLVFTSYASDLVENDTNDSSDIFLLNLETEKLRCLTKGGDGNSYNPVLSGDGSTVAFASLAGNLDDERVPRGSIHCWEEGWPTCRAVTLPPDSESSDPELDGSPTKPAP